LTFIVENASANESDYGDVARTTLERTHDIKREIVLVKEQNAMQLREIKELKERLQNIEVRAISLDN
jgi:hypothetical protein